MRPGLSPLQQFLFLRQSEVYPGVGRLGPGWMEWRWATRPTALSREYLMRLKYVQDGTPEIYAEQPDLKLLADGDKIPHLYRQRPARLCLYKPENGEWRPHDRFDLTLLPWADTWLFYFEDWLARGKTEWMGGGDHPDEDDDGTRWERRWMKRRYRRRRSA